MELTRVIEILQQTRHLSHLSLGSAVTVRVFEEDLVAATIVLAYEHGHRNRVHVSLTVRHYY